MLNDGLIVLVLRLALMSTFAIASIAKLLDKQQLANTLREFGVPHQLSVVTSKGLPAFELAVAIALLNVQTTPLGAFAALLLLLLFAGAMIYNLARGRRPRCNCFGQMSTAPIGPVTVIRNLVLTGFAALTLYLGPGPSVYYGLSWIGARAPLVGLSLGLLVAVLPLQAFLLFQVLRQQGRILARLNGVQTGTGAQVQQAAGSAGNTIPGLGIGSRAPYFSLPSLAGSMVSLSSLLADDDDSLLLFMNPHCGPCLALVGEAAIWMRDKPSGLNVFVITEGTPEENLEKTSDLIPAQVLLQTEREVADAYQAWGTPAAVVIRSNGTLGSGVAQGAEAIRSLLAVGAPVDARSTVDKGATRESSRHRAQIGIIAGSSS